MLRVGLDRGRQGQDLVLRRALDGDDAGQRRLALRERAGLVEDDDVELARPLEGEAVLHEQAVARAERGADGDDQRDGQAQRVRAGDDEHGGRAHEGLRRLTDDEPDEEGDGTGREGDVEEGRRGPVGERLGARARGLRLRDQAHDARERRLVTGGGDPHPQAATGGHRPGDDLVALRLRHGHRLAGDHRLVDIGRAIDDDAVDGHAGAGPDEHDVVHAPGRRAGPPRSRRR